MGKAAAHLSVSALADIARGCFTVKSNQNGELIGLCPAHEDSEPSFSYNPVKDVCHCFTPSCGFSGDIIALWAKAREIADPKEAFKAFYKEYNLSDDLGSPASSTQKNKKVDVPPLDEAYEKLGPLPAEWITRLVTTRGWNPLAIDMLGIRQQTHYQAKKTGDIKKLGKPERLAIPIRDIHGHVRNIRLYKPGAKKMKIISWGTAYGEARLFPPSPREDGTILLCEGEPDTICAISNGFNAITQTSKPKKWSKTHKKQFEGRDVVIAFDADQPGQSYAMDFAGPELIKVARSVRILTWPDFMGRREDGHWPEDHGQDLTDFFVRHKQTAVDLQRRMDDAKHFTAPEPDIQSEIYDFYECGPNGRLVFKPRLLADRIMQDYQLLFCPDTGLTYRWNGRYWEEFFEDHLKAVALKMLGTEGKQSMVTDAVFQIRALSTIPHGRALNDNLDYVCVKNGMLNINTGLLEDHAQDFYATYELGVTYNPESKDRCNKFLTFLDQTVQTPSVIAQVQEFFGYCFLRKTPFAKCLLLLGPGSDGKSTLLGLLRDMIGPENCAAVSFAEMEDQFLRSSLYQKAVNISTEVGSKAVESPYFKAITSGDPINAAFKHRNTFTFVAYCKQLFAANKMPRVRDNSDGFFRRILPIKFKKQFREGDKDTDPFLKDKLLKEKTEIFHWALAGLHRLLKNGRFTNCQETEDLLLEYKRLNNPVVCFCQDILEIAQDQQTSKKDLFSVYERYCRKNLYRAYSRENFFRELYAAHAGLKTIRPRKDNPARYPFIQGLKIKDYLSSD